MPVTPEQQAEIDELRSNAVPTLRAVAPGMEKQGLFGSLIIWVTMPRSVRPRG